MDPLTLKERLAAEVRARKNAEAMLKEVRAELASFRAAYYSTMDELRTLEATIVRPDPKLDLPSIP